MTPALPNVVARTPRPWWLWLLCVALLLTACTQPQSRQASDGVLDLRQWDPGAGPVRLDGEWQFSDGTLVGPGEPLVSAELRNVPDEWDTPIGLGTYRLTVLLPESAPPLHLQVGGIGGGGRIWIDDRELPPIGRVSADPHETRGSARESQLVFAAPADHTVELTIQVSNARYRLGGLHSPVVLATGDAARQHAEWFFLGQGISLAVTGTMVLCFLFFAALRRESTSLYFAGFCLTQIARNLAVGSPPALQLFWPELPRIPVLHIEYATLPIGSVFGIGLFAGFARIPTRRTWVQVCQAIGLVLAVCTIFNPPEWDGPLLRVNQLWMLISMGICLGMMGDARRRKVGDASYLLGLSALTSIIFGHDLLASLDILETPHRLANPGFLVFLGGMAGLMIYRFAHSLTRVERLAEALGATHARLERTHHSALRFVPVEFLHILGRDAIEQVRRGDRTDLTLTIQFSDIRSFTALTERLSPTQTFDLVSDYLERIGNPVHHHGGFIDKYIGDAMMALFTEADAALRSCLDQLQALDEANATRTERQEPPMEVGFGLHTGPVTLGTVGSQQRLDCTVLGDAVNLASRVEGLTSRYGTRLLVTASFIAHLPADHGRAFREVDRVVVKGKSEPVRVFEVLDAVPPAIRARRQAALDHFEAGRKALFGGQFAAATTSFAAALERDPEDRAARILMDRARRLAEAGESDPRLAVERLRNK